jgi:murein L,D-transpeptidase YafK
MRLRRLARGASFLLLFVLCGIAVFAFFASREQKQSLASLSSRLIPQLRPLFGQKSSGTLMSDLKRAGFSIGQPVLLRIFKQESELEVWMMRNGTYDHFKTYPICKWSGQLGPKLKEGDGQSPEGFYEVSLKQLNPNSRYHLAMNVGFPNVFDQSQSRTGSALMIHGSCVSIGCYAMTDAGIEDIYTLVEKALLAKQPTTPVHIFPFRMTVENLRAQSASPWLPFWTNLAEGDALFQMTKRAPTVLACNSRYYFDTAPQQCEKITGW